MAISRYGQVIKFGASADAITDRVKIQAITLEHSAAANAVFTDTAGHPVATLRVAANDLMDQVVFPKGIMVDGLIATALTATANLYVYIQ